jgi:hypothetical protein
MTTNAVSQAELEWIKCWRCDGSGEVESFTDYMGADTRDCVECSGTGRISSAVLRARDLAVKKSFARFVVILVAIASLISVLVWGFHANPLVGALALVGLVFVGLPLCFLIFSGAINAFVYVLTRLSNLMRASH